MGWFSTNHRSPIGIDIGTRSIKLAQLETADESIRVSALARSDLPPGAESSEARGEAIRSTLADLLRGGLFHGRNVVVSLNSKQLFVQNVRVPRIAPEELTKVVRWEAEERLPEDFGEAEIRHLIAGEIRLGSGAADGAESRQEVILLACRRKEIDELIAILGSLRLVPQAVDIPACAIVRASQPLLRRKTDEQTGMLYVDIGAATSNVVLTRGPEILLIKPIAVGGLSIDRLVARKLNMSVEDASLIRRQWSDSPVRDAEPDLGRAVGEAIRSELETLVSEVVMCLRYHSVTFRGNKITKAVLYGGEADPRLAEQFAHKLDLPCELGDPFVGLDVDPAAAEHLRTSRRGHWAVAVGLCSKPKARAA